MNSRQTSAAPPESGETVSFDSEALIIVDAQDRVLGYGTKAELHRGAAPYIAPFQYFCSTQRVKCCCKDAVSKSPFGRDIGRTPAAAIHDRGNPTVSPLKGVSRKSLASRRHCRLHTSFGIRHSLTISVRNMSCAQSTSVAPMRRPLLIHRRSVTGNGSALTPSMIGLIERPKPSRLGSKSSGRRSARDITRTRLKALV